MSNMKSVKIMGTNVKYTNIPQLAKQLNIGQTVSIKRTAAKLALVNIPVIKVIKNEQTGRIAKLDLSQKQTILRDFLGVKKITKEIKDPLIIGQWNNETIFINNKEISIKDNIQSDERISVYIEWTIRIWVSNQQFIKRRLSTWYTGTIGDIKYINKKYNLVITNPGLKSMTAYHHKYKEGEFNNAINDGYVDNKIFKKDKLIDTDDNNHATKKEKLIAFLNYFNGLERFVIEKTIKEYKFCNKILFEDLEITDGFNNKFDLKTMKLKLSNNSDLSNIFDDIDDIELNNDTCVITYLTSRYPKIDVSNFFSRMLDVSTIDIINFCKEFSILCTAYDFNGNIIDSYVPKVVLNKSLVYIAYNNHIYPFKNGIMTRKVYPEDIDFTFETKAILQDRFNKLIKDNIIPANISGILDGVEKFQINNLIHDNKMYINNDSYELLNNIMCEFGLSDDVTPNISSKKMMNHLEKLYKTNNTHSFWPALEDYIPTACKFYTERKDFEIKDLITIDKNKAYPCALHDLSHILCLDIKTCTIINNPDEIIDNWIYFVEPEKSHQILLPNSGLYESEHLIYCKKQGLKFKLIKGYECEVKENNFSKLIDDYMTKTAKFNTNDSSKKEIKDILNVFIGCMHQCCKVNAQLYPKICNKDEASLTSLPQRKINDNITICFDKKLHINTTTRKIIVIQIFNKINRMINDKLIVENIPYEDVIKIHTDSITFIGNGNKISNIDTSYNGWKYQEFSAISKGWYDFSETIDNTFIDILPKPSVSCKLHLGYAGCGKTHTIINKTIPYLKEQGKTFLVVSSSHSTIEEYRLLDIPCDVLQKYEFNYEIPKVDVIIVDEIGLCGSKLNDILYRFKLAGISINSYGDYEQLYPVTEVSHSNNKEYLNSFYDKQYMKNTNHRNNFTKEYYDNIINSKIDSIKEVSKHANKSYIDASVVICISNELCNIYNKKIMIEKDIIFGDIDFKCICKTNKLREYGIYNNFVLNVTSKDSKCITLNDQFHIPIKKFTKTFFKPAYARTLYNVQGKTLDSYYVPDEELHYFNDPRKAYTLISRLKQIITIIKPVEKVKTNNTLMKLKF